MATAIQADRASFSIPSIIALICGVLAFTSSAGWAVFAAIGAIILGVVGVLMALAPSVRGGMISIVSILLGVIGFVLALIRLIL
jgi:hypothetical protein